METLSSVSVERMKVQLLQKQSELTATIQAFEEFKELNKYVHVTSMRQMLVKLSLWCSVVNIILILENSWLSWSLRSATSRSPTNIWRRS